MFTGIVEGLGLIRRIESHGSQWGKQDKRLEIEPLVEFKDVTIGESISVDGVCLTVVFWSGKYFVVDVSRETLNRTTLGFKRQGDKVNLERALRPIDRLGGHIVTGHVDCLGVLIERYDEGRSIRFVFEIPEEFSHYVVEKGSIAINGISLTVNRCEGKRFDVNVIPHTASVTNIGLLKPGDVVNIETDVIGKYVEKILKAWNMGKPPKPSSGITEELLRTYGFIK